MHCPRCLSTPAATSVYRQPQHLQETRPTLVKEQHGIGLEIDRCTSCAGVFLDAGELERLEALARGRRVGSRADNLPDLLRRAYAQARRPDDTSSEEKQPRDCPHCDGVMFEREWSIGTMVRVDVCIDCRGVWLDEGEMESLIKLFGG